MRSRARFLGHAIHPVLIVFPLGLLATAVIFDLIHLVTDNRGFTTAAAYTMGTGILGGLLAGLFGFIDWLGIPSKTRAKRIGALHGVGNVVVLLLFAISWLLRLDDPAWVPNGAALAFSFAGIVLAGVTGWLGGELVERLGIGVDEGADVNAKSSLSGSIAPGQAKRSMG